MALRKTSHRYQGQNANLFLRDAKVCAMDRMRSGNAFDLGKMNAKMFLSVTVLSLPVLKTKFADKLVFDFRKMIEAPIEAPINDFCIFTIQ